MDFNLLQYCDALFSNQFLLSQSSRQVFGAFSSAFDIMECQSPLVCNWNIKCTSYEPPQVLQRGYAHFVARYARTDEITCILLNCKGDFLSHMLTAIVQVNCEYAHIGTTLCLFGIEADAVQLSLSAPAPLLKIPLYHPIALRLG